MTNTINSLKKEVKGLSDFYIIVNRVNIIEEAVKLIPDIKEFVFWFIKTEDFGIETEEKNAMNAELLRIFDDIAVAIEKQDSVLMIDALRNGLYDYLLLFSPEEDESDE